MKMFDEKYMKIALNEAQIAFDINEVPVGAVIVYQDQIIARAHNLREREQNPLAHAEIIAINEASNALNTWRLDNCSIYITCEPCPMCAGAIMQARIGTIVFGTKDPKYGALGSSFNLFMEPGINIHPHIFGGICDKESKELLQSFFAKKRK